MNGLGITNPSYESRNAIIVWLRLCRAVIHPDAAGIDIGATQIYVAVSPDRDTQPVRHFDTFTEDLEALADGLIRCGGVRDINVDDHAARDRDSQ